MSWTCVVLVCLCAVARTQVIPGKSRTNDGDYNSVNTDGSFDFGYTNKDRGQSYHLSHGNANKVVGGRFGARDPATDTVKETVYTAGPRGFRAKGPNVHRKMDLDQRPRGPIGNKDDPFFDPNEDPSYGFKFDTRTYSKNENADSRGDVKGHYSFVDDVGERHDVAYTAGRDTGFHVSSSHPDSPTVIGSPFHRAPLVRGETRPRGRTAVQRGLDGSYRFISAGPDQRRTESSDSHGNVRGSYTFLDDKGVQRTVNYIAGPGIGYRIVKSSKDPYIPPYFPTIPSAYDPDFVSAGAVNYSPDDSGSDDVFKGPDGTAASGHVKPPPFPIGDKDRPSNKPGPESTGPAGGSDGFGASDGFGGSDTFAGPDNFARPDNFGGPDAFSGTDNFSPPTGSSNSFNGPSGPSGTNFKPPSSGSGSNFKPSSGGLLGIGSGSYKPPSGPSGSNSYKPPSGPSGSNSYKPPSGPSGANSYKPASGPSGTSSYKPPSGPSGSNSYKPPSGPSGSNSYKPPSSASGSNSFNAPSGPSGPNNFNRPSGPSSASGSEEDSPPDGGYPGPAFSHGGGSDDIAYVDEAPVAGFGGSTKPTKGPQGKPGRPTSKPYRPPKKPYVPLKPFETHSTDDTGDFDDGKGDLPLVPIAVGFNLHRNIGTTIIRNIGRDYFGVPPGVSVRAHVQSIDLYPFDSKPLSPSEAIEKDKT